MRPAAALRGKAAAAASAGQPPVAQGSGNDESDESGDEGSEGTAAPVSKAPVRKLRMVELCGGSHVLLKAFRGRRWDGHGYERDERRPEWDDAADPEDAKEGEALLPRSAVTIADINTLGSQKIQNADYAHASPSCQSNSTMAAWKHQRTSSNEYRGVTEEAADFDRTLATILLYAGCVSPRQTCHSGLVVACRGSSLSPGAVRNQKERSPSFGFSIEQPQGTASKLLRLRDIENRNLPLACTKVTFDQCKAGRTRWKKRTDVWISNNLPTLIKFLGDPKFKCTPKSPCWCAARVRREAATRPASRASTTAATHRAPRSQDGRQARAHHGQELKGLGEVSGGAGQRVGSVCRRGPRAPALPAVRVNNNPALWCVRACVRRSGTFSETFQ